MKFNTLLTISLSIISLIALAGCGIDLAYLVPQAGGQADVLLNAVPIDEAIATGDLTETEIKKLRLIKDVRLFAAENIGLFIENNYTLYYDTGGDPIAWNVSASRRDRFEPQYWNFPFVGDIPYLGYFDQIEAAQKVYDLQQDGLDVYMYSVDAYSTLATLPNPVFSGMLNRSDLSITETILHELLHATVWKAGDTTFNESLATFVGRNGTMTYLADRYPDQPELIELAQELYEDNNRFNEFFFEMYNRMDAYYNQPISQPEKLKGREAMFQAERDTFANDVQPLLHYPANYDWMLDFPTNNAWVLANYRYNFDLDTFDAVFEAMNQDWPASIALFKKAADADDPWQYLEDWLANQTEPDTEIEAD